MPAIVPLVNLLNLLMQPLSYSLSDLKVTQCKSLLCPINSPDLEIIKWTSKSVIKKMCTSIFMWLAPLSYPSLQTNMGTRLLDKSVASVHTPTDAIGIFNHKRKPPSVIIFLYIWYVIAHLPTLKFFCRGCLCIFQDWASISPTDFGIEPLTHHICVCPLYLSEFYFLCTFLLFVLFTWSGLKQPVIVQSLPSLTRVYEAWKQTAREVQESSSLLISSHSDHLSCSMLNGLLWCLFPTASLRN